MKKLLFLAILVSIVLISGCVEQVVCNEPYIQVGKECCIDSDHNKVCDKDETFEENSKVVITEKEPQIVEKEVVVKEYVCADGSIVDDTSKCPIEESVPIEEEVELKIPDLVMDNEGGTVINEVSAEPACANGLLGGEIYFKVGTVPDRMAVEVKEIGADTEFKEVYSRTGLYDGYLYFAICEQCRGAQINFKLKPDKAYIMRLMFDQTNVYGRIEYSNEHLIDAREGELYRLKLC